LALSAAGDGVTKRADVETPLRLAKGRLAGDTAAFLQVIGLRLLVWGSGQARHEIRQNIGANDTLSVSLAVAIYSAAGRPQGKYSCLVRTDVRYRVFDEWCYVKLETCRVEMAGLIAFGLSSARWYDKKIKQSSASPSSEP